MDVHYHMSIFKCAQMLKQIHVQLHPPQQPHWHGDIKKHWHSTGDKIPFIFFVFHCWIWGTNASCIYQQRSKYRQEEITKHASTGTDYAILTKQIKVNHEKKLELNLYAESTFWANIYKMYWHFHSARVISVAETVSVAINDSSDVLCFDLYPINLFHKSLKAERCTDFMFNLTLYCLSATVEGLHLYCYCWRSTSRYFRYLLFSYPRF